MAQSRKEAMQEAYRMAEQEGVCPSVLLTVSLKDITVTTAFQVAAV